MILNTWKASQQWTSSRTRSNDWVPDWSTRSRSRFAPRRGRTRFGVRTRRGRQEAIQGGRIVYKRYVSIVLWTSLVADYCRLLRMKTGIHLLRDVLVGAIGRKPDLVLDEQGNLPDSMPSREWRQLFLEGYKIRCNVNEVPRRVVEVYDEFMKARHSRKQNDKSTGKEWTFGEMCEEADPVGKVIGWKARLPHTEEQSQPPIPSRPCADYSSCHPVAIIGRPGQHSVCDCKDGTCKFRNNPTELRTVALGLVCCDASIQDGECSCLKEPSGGGKGVHVRVLKSLKHGQTHPREGGGDGRTTKNLLHNSSGQVITDPLAEYDEIWCPSQLVVQVDEVRMRELRPKRGRKAKDNADEDPPPDEEDPAPEVEATRRSQRRRIENSRYPGYDMGMENV